MAIKLKDINWQNLAFKILVTFSFVQLLLIGLTVLLGHQLQGQILYNIEGLQLYKYRFEAQSYAIVFLSIAAFSSFLALCIASGRFQPKVQRPLMILFALLMVFIFFTFMIFGTGLIFIS